MAKNWSPEQREAAAHRAQQNRPWAHSTGPRTFTGKRTSSQNSYKHGRFSYEKQILRWYVRLAALRVKQVKADMVHYHFRIAEFSRQKTKEWNELSSARKMSPRYPLRFPDHLLKQDISTRGDMPAKGDNKDLK